MFPWGPAGSFRPRASVGAYPQEGTLTAEGALGLAQAPAVTEQVDMELVGVAGVDQLAEAIVRLLE